MPMTRPDPLFANAKPMARLWHAAAALLLLAGLSACVAPPPAAPASPFEDDINHATEGLVDDLRSRYVMPLFMHRLAPNAVAMGSFVDAGAAGAGKSADFALPQSIANAKARQLIGKRLDGYAPELRRLDAEPSAQGSVRLLLNARLALMPGSDPARPELRRLLTLVLLDPSSHEVVARWQGPVRIEAADAFPTRFEADSPVLFSESAQAAQASAKLFDSTVGTRLPDDALPSAGPSGLLSQAQDAYAAGDYAAALALFQRLAAQPSAESMRVYNGLYLSYLKLGREDDAKVAFRHVVSEGLAARALAVKLLFTPGQTSFWSDPAVSGLYDFWLQEIASQSAASSTCVNVVGHTSRTGAEAFNLQLSLARGEKVMSLLETDAPALATRLNAQGKGWSENLVGSGTDDARDAIDRRVEFRIVDCAAAH